MKRLFVPPETLQKDTARLCKSDHHHISRVMRLGVGDRLELADGSGRLWTAEIATVTAKETRLEILEELPVELPRGPVLRLLFGIARGHRTDFILQKSTELGVDELWPVICERSVARPKEADQKQRRWREIVRQATRQCERLKAPHIAPPSPLAQALSHGHQSPALLVASATGDPCSEALSWGQVALSEVVMLVGPEGGLSAKEQAHIEARGFVPVSLGPHILRAETAAAALMTIVNHLSGRWAPPPNASSGLPEPT